MKRKAWIGVAVVAVVVVLLVGVVLQQRPSGPKEHRIGVVLSLTGRGATYGQRSLKGMELAVEELNQSDPFKTNPILLIVEDSQSDATRALTAFRKLVDLDHVPVVVGMVLTDEVLACAPVANQTKTVILTPGAGGTELEKAGPYIFRSRESAAYQTEAVAKSCVEDFGFKEVGIIHANAANGISYRDSFTKAAESLGATVTVTVGYNEGKTDYRAEIQQLRQKNPPAVYLAGHDTEMAAILKQCREVGFAPKFFASAGAVSKKLIEIAENAAEGMVCATAWFDADSDEGKVKTFVTAYKQRNNDPPDWVAANSYDAMHIIAAIFARGALGAEQIKDGLHATSAFQGIAGTTTFDKNGGVTKPVGLVIVRNGLFQRVE